MTRKYYYFIETFRKSFFFSSKNIFVDPAKGESGKATVQIPAGRVLQLREVDGPNGSSPTLRWRRVKTQKRNINFWKLFYKLINTYKTHRELHGISIKYYFHLIGTPTKPKVVPIMTHGKSFSILSTHLILIFNFQPHK